MSRDYLDYLYDRYDEQETAEYVALMRARRQQATPRRCEGCGYLENTTGHAIACAAERAA